MRLPNWSSAARIGGPIDFELFDGTFYGPARPGFQIWIVVGQGGPRHSRKSWTTAIRGYFLDAAVDGLGAN